MMRQISKPSVYRFASILFTFMLLALAGSPAQAAEYPALEGVKGLKVVFDVSLSSPQQANLVFPAVMNLYQNEQVQALPEKPRVAVVFHGQAVHLISSDRMGYSEKDIKALDEFAGKMSAMKADGVTLEVCLYAVNILSVDPDSILPEVDKVGNGFISVAGYQAQGYSVITIAD